MSLVSINIFRATGLKLGEVNRPGVSPAAIDRLGISSCISCACRISVKGQIERPTFGVVSQIGENSRRIEVPNDGDRVWLLGLIDHREKIILALEYY